ncbi:MAG: 3-hydroxybenzoate 6-monooxygenase [Alphaproteobacteria bacterium]|nr:3-hydroxybenzoate 6-monooxygenase [Alphaproteobacteria bacterium]
MSPHARNALPVAIAGGGIGGLACALALAQRGFQSLVLEQAAEFGEAGVGLQVAPNALSVLDALGVGETAKKHALLIERLVMMDAVSGAEVVNVPCGDRFRERFRNPYAVAHRADIHGALLDACRAHELVALRNDCRVKSFDLDDRRVSVLLETGERIAAAAIVGADGVDSAVRRQLLGDGPPLASGAVIYRATIPVFEMPKDLQRPYPTFWAGPGWHVIYYPVRDWTMFNLGGTVVTGERTPGESEDVSQRHVLPLFAGSCATPLRVLRIPKTFRRYSIVHREPVENWSQGPATLLGDAAHPMVQYIAQGAAMALEDAICLAVAAYECDGNFTEAFKRYQDHRTVRAARVQISSSAMDRINHARGIERKVRNALFEGRTAEEFYDRLAWLFTPPSYVKPFKP